MSIKIGLGKLHLNKTVIVIANLCKSTGIDIMAITPEDCQAIQSLPPIHKDPYDRIIMAQAIRKAASIVINDEKICQYHTAKTIW